MRVLEVRHRDTYFLMDLSLAEIRMLKAILDTATFEFDGEENPLAKKGSDYIENQLYPLMVDILESSPSIGE